MESFNRGVFALSIIYKCNYCGIDVGRLEQQVIDTSILGWDKLSNEDKKEMIRYQSTGDVHILTICESCEETLGLHPEYHELENFIQ